MANRSRLGGYIVATDFNYGGVASLPAALRVYQPNPSAIGSATLTLEYGQVGLSDGTNIAPLNINAPVYVGVGSNAELVTLTAVSNPTPGIYGTPTITATFANAHGIGDLVTSGTFGLQEAVNFAVAQGSGTVLIDQTWYNLGGTVAIAEAVAAGLTYALNVGQSNNEVRIFDQTTMAYFGQRASTNTLLGAPSIPLISQLASLPGVGGTFTAATYYFNFIYVDANGGLTAASSQYSFTATASVAVGGSGPVAEAGAVGYLVASSATSTTYINNPLAATSSGTIINCGGVNCFAIGTSFTITAPGTSALPLVPVRATAYKAAWLPVAAQNMLQPFKTIWPPFAATGTLTAGTAIEMGRVDLPTGFLNIIGRTLRITANGVFTPVSGATLIFSLELYSVYGETGTVISTVGNTAATSGTAASTNFKLIYEITTAAVGATGTLECHCHATYQLVDTTVATTGVAAVSLDNTSAPSGTVDLTKQDTLSFIINSGTQNLTTAQLRQLIVEVLV
jgi:hypothetical protein